MALVPGAAFGAQRSASDTDRSSQQNRAGAGRVLSSPIGQHGAGTNHLPARRENMEVVGRLEATAPFGDVKREQIADLAVFDGFAYLNSWNDPECERGGVHVMDIRDPASPKAVGFIPATPGYYHGEGAHVVSLTTAAFKGDLLAVNNEPYSSDCGAPSGTGGFELYDVSNPAAPVPLSGMQGDRTPDDTSLEQQDRLPNAYHSVFVWQDGVRAYLVGVDNAELHDVDIFDITDPRSPVQVADHDLVELFPQILEDGLGNQSTVLHHDMVVKSIAGKQTMMVSYWDAGYVQLDVSDPTKPVYLHDTGFGVDPLTGFDPAEGNAHQAEFSFDDRFYLAADEDFAPYRSDAFRILTGPQAGEHPAADVSGGTSVSILPDRRLNGPTVYGGYGCDASKPVPRREDVDVELGSGEEAIIVLQRGPSDDPNNTEDACFPGEKAANGIEAGWDAVLLANRHLGSADADEPFCGAGGFPAGAAIVTLCTTHTAFHHIFGSEPNYDDYTQGEPALGEVGEEVEGTASFDGWGYAHLYDRASGEEVDAFAIEEALDPRYAFGFGDLSIHEFATDPGTNLAYAAYYAGGLRVFRFGGGGLEQTGVLIDQGGSNFWGVEQFTHPAYGRLIAASDRDFGLVIARYTGPGAVGPVAPPAAPPAVTPTEEDRPRAARPDNFFAFGDLRTLTVPRTRRLSFAIRVPGPGRATVTLRASIGGKSLVIGRGRGTASRAGALRLSMTVSRTGLARLKRTLANRRTSRTNAILRTSFIPEGGDRRTRNKTISLRAR